MLAAVKMQGTVFNFQICVLAIAFIFFPGICEGRYDGILNRQSLMTVRVYSHGYQKRLIFAHEKSKHNLFGKFVEYYNLFLNKTCNYNRCYESTEGYPAENVP